MSTESVNSFRPLIEREVRGAPTFTVKDAILRACRQFCEETFVWKEYLDDMPAIANIRTYDLDPPANTRVVTILSMRYKDRDLTPKTIDQLVQERHNWQDLKSTQARHWVQENPESFTLVPYPSESEFGGIQQIRVALKPTMSATAVGSILYEDYDEAIAAGALARLQAVPGKPWSDPKRAMEHEANFSDAMSLARVRSRKDYSRANLYAQAQRRFGGP